MIPSVECLTSGRVWGKTEQDDSRGRAVFVRPDRFGRHNRMWTGVEPEVAGILYGSEKPVGNRVFGLGTRDIRHSGSWTDKRSEEHTSELQSRLHLVCRLLLEKKNRVNAKPPTVSECS